MNMNMNLTLHHIFPMGGVLNFITLFELHPVVYKELISKYMHYSYVIFFFCNSIIWHMEGNKKSCNRYNIIHESLMLF